MSRVGRMPIKIPNGLTVVIDPAHISVQGPKGTLSQFTMPDIAIEHRGEELIVSRANEEPKTRAKHGLMRALLQNMITGVNEGFSKQLEVNGVGFRINLAGADLKMNLGFSHEVVYKIPEGVTVKVEQNIITLTSISKQQVGQVAAEIRALKKPEPYKGKGIKYVGERILRKSGKSGKDK